MRTLLTASQTPTRSPPMSYWGCLTHRSLQLAHGTPSALDASLHTSPSCGQLPFWASKSSSESELWQMASKHMQVANPNLWSRQRPGTSVLVPPLGKQKGTSQDLGILCFRIQKRHTSLKILTKGSKKYEPNRYIQNIQPNSSRIIILQCTWNILQDRTYDRLQSGC